MPQSTWYLDRGDTAAPIAQTLLDGNNNAVVLTGASVKFHMEDSAGNVVVDAAATIPNPTGGGVQYAWQAADVANAGTFYARWIVTFAGGTIESFPDNNTNPLLVIIQGSIAPFRILVGSGKEDVVGFVRDQIEDYTDGNFVIPDGTFTRLASRVTRDLARFYPMQNVVGNVFAATSPLMTVNGQQRYICNSANGFTGEIARITDVLYRATSGFNAASEIGYLALLPFSPANTFLFTPSLVDSPTRRLLRNLYLNEIDHYGIGKDQDSNGQAGIMLDSNGNFVIDLYPIPQSALPIYVRYDINHVVVNDSQGNATIPTLPGAAVRHFQSLLLAEVMRIVAIRITQQVDATAGMTAIKADPEQLKDLARDLRDDTYLELGYAAGIGDTSS